MFRLLRGGPGMVPSLHFGVSSLLEQSGYAEWEAVFL